MLQDYRLHCTGNHAGLASCEATCGSTHAWFFYHLHQEAAQDQIMQNQCDVLGTLSRRIILCSPWRAGKGGSGRGVKWGRLCDTCYIICLNSDSPSCACPHHAHRHTHFCSACPLLFSLFCFTHTNTHTPMQGKLKGCACVLLLWVNKHVKCKLLCNIDTITLHIAFTDKWSDILSCYSVDILTFTTACAQQI